MRKLFTATCLVLGLAAPSVALASSGMATNTVLLQKGDNRTGTFYASGQTVTVDGDVDGDVVCAGQSVVINGAVKGDVLCAGQDLTVNGAVTGSVRAIGQLVTINGTVGRNVTVGGQTVVLGSGSHVAGELAAGAQTLTINGPVDHDAMVGTNSLTLGAVIGGSLNYLSNRTLPIDHDKVRGDIVRHDPPRAPSRQNMAGARLASLLFWVLGGLAIMLVAVWLIPGMVRGITNIMVARPGASIGWGALATLSGPPLLLVLALTVIGIPLALLLGALWFTIAATAGLLSGVAVGRLALGRRETSRRQLMLATLTGVPLVVIVTWLPWVGAIVGLATIAWAMGGVLFSLRSAR
jgi:cytoskeletal protein CcmA (bactofilin family)